MCFYSSPAWTWSLRVVPVYSPLWLCRRETEFAFPLFYTWVQSVFVRSTHPGGWKMLLNSKMSDQAHWNNLPLVFKIYTITSPWEIYVRIWHPHGESFCFSDIVEITQHSVHLFFGCVTVTSKNTYLGSIWVPIVKVFLPVSSCVWMIVKLCGITINLQLARQT